MTSLNQMDINNVTLSNEQESMLSELPESPFFQNSNLSQLLQEIHQTDIVVEEEIVPEMVRQTRIVNGEECPPGECPWQVP